MSKLEVTRPIQPHVSKRITKACVVTNLPLTLWSQNPNLCCPVGQCLNCKISNDLTNSSLDFQTKYGCTKAQFVTQTSVSEVADENGQNFTAKTSFVFSLVRLLDLK